MIMLFTCLQGLTKSFYTGGQPYCDHFNAGCGPFFLVNSRSKVAEERSDVLPPLVIALDDILHLQSEVEGLAGSRKTQKEKHYLNTGSGLRRVLLLQNHIKSDL